MLVERCLACEADGRNPWSVASLARPTGRDLLWLLAQG